ncbi:response regulator [Oceaniglobus indicus]|uniref:response regulator n=1 Tax=Oceaniglobus indicus TaxID=2047749 RepID=UPI000C18CBF0|nr:response regulator [Oceaniglobus indicus]
MSRPLILCVEDEPSLRDDIAADLREAGYDVSTARDASEALVRLNERRPELVLCDIVMPGMDGRALLAHLRATRPDLDDIPFVFLTALSSREQMIEGRQAGADDYLTKPIDYDLLRAMIAARLDQVHRLRSARSEGFQIAALDRLAIGIVLLDSDGGVVHTNFAAKNLAQQAQSSLGSRLTAQGEDGRRLCALVAEVTSDTRSGAALLLNPDDRRVMVIGRSLGSSRAQNGATAMLTLCDPMRREALDAAALRQLFDLTPTEACVARLVADGLRRDQVAERLGVSATTVAFHLRNIFDKTGTHRQADLVALILSMPMASVDPLDPPAAENTPTIHHFRGRKRP